MQVPPQVPTTPLVPHPKVDALKAPFEALKTTFESRVEQLNPQDAADLQQLEANLQRMAELRPHLSLDPAASLDLFEEAVSAKKETLQLQQQSQEIAERHRRFPAELFIYGQPGDSAVSTGVSWQQQELSPQLRALGYSEARYSLTLDRENRDLKADAQLVRQDGQADSHYLKYRISMAPSHRWRGADLTLGNAEDMFKLEATPLGMGSDDLYVRDDSHVQHWSATEQAFAAQALRDLGVGWLVPMLCPHCK